MTSILDVANEANVAASTVSRVINGSSRISPSTQERVREAIRRVGYTPSAPGKRRKQQQAWQVAVVYSPYMVVNGALVNFCREWIGGIRQAIIEVGGHLEIFAGAEHVECDAMYQHSLDHGELHGLILLGAQRDSRYVEDAQARGVPIVMVSDRSPRGDVSSIYADLYNASRRSVDYLVELGHKRIGLGRLPSGLLWSSDRWHQGVLDALTAHGLSLSFEHVGEPDFDDIDYFDDAAEQLLATGTTAISTGDQSAVRYIEALHRRGVRVPEDVSVIGRGNTGLVPETGQALTTIAYDKPFMGRLAATTLFNLLQNRDQIQHIESSVPTRLIKRDTTAAAPAASR